MRSTQLLACLVAAAVADTFATDYDARRVVQVDASTRLAMRTVEFELTRAGKPMGVASGVGDESVDERHVVVLDRVLESAAGVPVRLEREFRTVEGRAQRKIAGHEFDDALDCPLDDATLVLRRGADRVDVEVAIGERPDDELLSGHRLELALDALLPARAVAVGDAWELDDDAVGRLLGFDTALVLFPRRESPGANAGFNAGRGPRGGSHDFAALVAARWKGTATFAALEEHAGERCARIDVELTSSGAVPTVPIAPADADGEGEETGRHVERQDAPPAVPQEPEPSGTRVEATLRGHMFFALDARRPVLLEIAGDVEVAVESTYERNGATIERKSRRTGAFSQRVELSSEDL